MIYPDFCATCGCDVFECGGNITGRCNRQPAPSTAPAAPARAEAEQASGDDLAGAIACCRAWEPDARLIGNVRASTLLALLERAEAEQAVLDAAAAWFDRWSEQYGPAYLLALWVAQKARREAAK